MDTKMKKFLCKYSIVLEDIKYIVREDGKTNVHLLDGRVISTYHSIKEFREFLPIEQFLYPNKGIIAAASQIVNIHDGCYEMVDGRKFKYRVHNSQLHDNRILMLGRSMERLHATAEAESPGMLQSHFSVLDHMPLPVCAVEYTPAEQGLGGDFIFRYCNQALTDFVDVPADQILNHSCFELYPNIDRKWLVVCADVALNHTARIIEEFHSTKKLPLRIYCYQPMPGYCIYIIVPFENFPDPKNTDSLPHVEFL